MIIFIQYKVINLKKNYDAKNLVKKNLYIHRCSLVNVLLISWGKLLTPEFLKFDLK